MANFKRKRTKHITESQCGHKHCKYDLVHTPTENGRNRYLPMYWKKLGGQRPWRYTHKNVNP